MTDLLSPAAARTTSAPPAVTAVTAVTAGLASAGTMILVSVALALTGWFAADAGRYGDTRDAVRVGVDAWLLAHGAGLRLDAASITVMPLGLTLLCAYAAYRSGRRAVRRAGLGRDAVDLRPVLTLAAGQASVYAVVALVVAVLAVHPAAEPHPLRALAGGFLLALLSGTAGALTGSGQGRGLVAGRPAWLRSVLAGAAATVLLVLAGAAVLVAVALLLDFGTAATVLSRLHADGPGGLMYTVVGSAFVPNAILLGTAYLLGPGFAVGTGTVVSTTAVVLGPVPAFPLLAALPADGATAGWTTALMGVPVVLAAAGVVLAARLVPVDRFDHGALRGLGAGLLAALVLAVLVSLAGGSAGPGRMADVGAPVVDTFLAAAVSFGGGGLIGGLVAAWSGRRR